MWPSANLTVRLFALVTLAVLPALAIEIYDETQTEGMREREGQDQALRLARLVAGEQSQVIEGARQLLTALGRTPFVVSGQAAVCNPFFLDLARAYPQYVAIVSTDLAGHQICTSGTETASRRLVDGYAFNMALRENSFIVGKYTTGRVSDRKIIPLSQPYLDADGRNAGIVSLGLSVDWLNASIARQPLPPKSTISVVDRSGTIVARFPEMERFVGQTISGDSHASLLSGKEGARESIGFDGISRIYSYTPVPGTQASLVVSVGLEKQEVLRGAEAEHRRSILIIAAGAVLAFLSAGFGARIFLRRPIQALLGTVERWRRGDLQARVDVRDSQSEFARLGLAFNSMADAVATREEELERRVQDRTLKLQAAMEAQHVAEAALQQAQKMETIGRLSGGIAHDFNNLLAGIVGNVELAIGELKADHPVRSRLDAALRSASRGAALTQRLLAFARRQHLDPEIVDTADYIDTLKDVLQRLVRPDIVVETLAPSNTWFILVDPTQLETAILNLAINARDAMPKGGHLRLRTRNVALKGDKETDEPSGDFVAISISDTGTGIEPANLDKVFEPFFSTKEVGKGSGLGLSMVQGFARQSSGLVSIDSVVGEGTTVTLYLPRSCEAAMTARDTVPNVTSGEGAVLLVDDDHDVGEVVAEMLLSLGYSVQLAQDAEQALQLYDESTKIDILVTDLVLPGGTDGIELASLIRQRSPDLPIVLITGYSEVLSQHEQIRGAIVLAKPFQRKYLATAISRAAQMSKSIRSVPETAYSNGL
jgi:signal transduction histidine kinase/CheY-like chemotaxis protein